MAQIPEYREQFLFPLLYSWETPNLNLGQGTHARGFPAAAADVAAANSGPIGTHGLHSGEDEVHRSSADARTASPLPPPYAD